QFYIRVQLVRYDISFGERTVRRQHNDIEQCTTTYTRYLHRGLPLGEVESPSSFPGYTILSKGSIRYLVIHRDTKCTSLADDTSNEQVVAAELRYVHPGDHIAKRLHHDRGVVKQPGYASSLGIDDRVAVGEIVQKFGCRYGNYDAAGIRRVVTRRTYCCERSYSYVAKGYQ